MLGKLPVLGHPTNLDYRRARACCTCSRCGWGLFGHFFSHLSLLFSFSLSLCKGGGRVVRRCWVNFRCLGILLIWIIEGQGPVVLAVGVGGGCLDIFSLIYHFSFLSPSLWERGRSGGAKVLGKLSVPGRPAIWIIVGQGPIALAVGAGGGCLDIFTLLYPFSPLSPSLWETARYRLKYCLKGPLNPKQPTNQLCAETAFAPKHFDVKLHLLL